MSARILVVDDLLPNVKLLEARLTAEYFDVVTAMSGAQALALCEQGACDIVLTDVMMPEMDGFEVCRRLKASPATAHIPVVIVTALDQPSDRVRGLEAGADDFLTKPVDEIALVARMRSLARLKFVVDELRARAAASYAVGLGDPAVDAPADSGLGGRILVVEDRESAAERIVSTLSATHTVELVSDPHAALFGAGPEVPDLAIVSIDLQGSDGLRLCSQLRRLERTRHVGILIVSDGQDNRRIVRGLDLGVNDYLLRPIDRNELLARVRTQIRRKRYADRLRDTVHASLELAIVDPLTGLHNRRYLDAQLAPLVRECLAQVRPLSLLILDVDRFKTVNDTYGHDAGDDVLRELAARLRSCVRSRDMVIRLGGEELVVVMPDMPLETARAAAERIRARIEGEPFRVHKGLLALDVTASIGVSALSQPGDGPGALLRRADEALYAAKAAGRNVVVVRAAAA